MKLELTRDDGLWAWVSCAGEISQIRFRGSDNPLEDVLGPGCYGRHVMLDARNAEWIDSSGISWLIASHKRFNAEGGRLVLHSLPPRVKTVLQFCRIDTVLNVAGDEADAKALVESAAG